MPINNAETTAPATNVPANVNAKNVNISICLLFIHD